MSKTDIEGVKHRGKKRVVMLLKNGTLYSQMQDLTKAQRAVLDCLIKEMAEDLNTVIVAKDTRESILNQTSVTNGSLSTILNTLKKKGFIEKTIVPNEYMVSPMLAYSGSYENVMHSYLLFENELRRSKGIKELP